MSEVVTEVRDTAGLITLNRPRALNALSLDMIRALTVTLLAWADNYLIHTYPKPYVVFMDGVVMGGGMGISAHGSDESLRIATERTRCPRRRSACSLTWAAAGSWLAVRGGWASTWP